RVMPGRRDMDGQERENLPANPSILLPPHKNHQALKAALSSAGSTHRWTLDEFFEKRHGGANADAAGGAKILTSHGGYLPEFGLRESITGVAKGRMSVVIRPLALDKSHRLAVLNNHKIHFPPLYIPKI